MTLYVKKLEYQTDHHGSHNITIELLLPTAHTQDHPDQYNAFFKAIGEFGHHYFYALNQVSLSSDLLLELSQRMFEIEQLEKKQKMGNDAYKEIVKGQSEDYADLKKISEANLSAFKKFEFVVDGLPPKKP